MKKNYNCHFEMVLDLIGGKWKPIILFYIIKHGKARHSELKRFIPAINERVLSRQLHELEADNLIIRKVYPTLPLKVEYTLTSFGDSLAPILISLLEWGKYYAKENQNINFNMDILELES